MESTLGQTPSVPKTGNRPLRPHSGAATTTLLAVFGFHRDVGGRRSSTAPLPGFRVVGTDFCGLAAPAIGRAFFRLALLFTSRRMLRGNEPPRVAVHRTSGEVDSHSPCFLFPPSRAGTGKWVAAGRFWHRRAWRRTGAARRLTEVQYAIYSSRQRVRQGASLGLLDGNGSEIRCMIATEQVPSC
jgi:hypothetical protein